MANGDISSLPKWAQQMIRDLRNQVMYRDNHIKKLIQDLRNAVGSVDGELTNVVLNPYNLDDDIMYLPNRSCIQFRLDAHRYIDVSFCENTLEVRSGTSRVSVEPRASNSFVIKLAD